MKKIATCLISSMLLATAVAQDDLLDELVVEEIRRYTVEIIVFVYEENVSVGTEIFPPDEPPVEIDPLMDDQDIPIDAQQVPVADFDADRQELEAEAEEAPAWSIDLDASNNMDGQIQAPDTRPLRITLLSDDELTLANAIRKFELLDAYRTIMHVGWTQPTYHEQQTPPIELRLLAEPPAGLEGTFTLYLSRYLHLVVDLALDGPDNAKDPIGADDSFFSFGDSRANDDDGLFGLAPQPVRYRLKENRILKNGELRYFDHPKFGVLAKVTRVEEDENDSGAELAEPLLGGSRQ